MINSHNLWWPSSTVPFFIINSSIISVTVALSDVGNIKLMFGQIWNQHFALIFPSFKAQNNKRMVQKTKYFKRFSYPGPKERWQQEIKRLATKYYVIFKTVIPRSKDFYLPGQIFFFHIHKRENSNNENFLWINNVEFSFV